MKNLTVILIAALLLMMALVQHNMLITQRNQTRTLTGHEEDLLNLQQQIDGTYRLDHPKTPYDASTPRVLRPRVGVHGPTQN